MGSTQVMTPDGMVAADQIAVTGDLTLDLWYAKERWVKLVFKGEDGSVIDYRLERSGLPSLTFTG